MYYVGTYGNNDYRDYLAHYGRKGMKWGKNLFGDDKAYAQLKSRLQGNVSQNRLSLGRSASNTARNAGQVKKGLSYTKSYLTGRSNNGSTGIRGSETKKYARATGAAVGATARSGVRTAGAAIQYAGSKAQLAAADAIRTGYKAFMTAKKSVIDFGKSTFEKAKGLYGKIKDGFNSTLDNVKSGASDLFNKGKNFISGIFEKAGVAIKSVKAGIRNTKQMMRMTKDVKTSLKSGMNVAKSQYKVGVAAINNRKLKKNNFGGGRSGGGGSQGPGMGGGGGRGRRR